MVELVVTLRLEVPEVVMLAGVKVAAAPTGRPAALSETTPVNPLLGVTETE